MDIIEAINSRYSVRAFRPDPVPKKLLQELLTASLHAPSWANTQTWELYVTGGQIFKELKETLAARAFGQDDRVPDIPRPTWPSPYSDRRKQNGVLLYKALGISRDDIEAQLMWFVDMYSFFGAPNAIFICTERNLSSWAMMNIGLLAQTICLAALDLGLGTAILAAGSSYPDTVKYMLNIPESKQLVISIAIGYPNIDAPANRYRSERVSLDEVCCWCGL